MFICMIVTTLKYLCTQFDAVSQDNPEDNQTVQLTAEQYEYLEFRAPKECQFGNPSTKTSLRNEITPTQLYNWGSVRDQEANAITNIAAQLTDHDRRVGSALDFAEDDY